MNPESYLRPPANQVFTSELEIKRSRFIGFASRVSSETEAREFISSIKSQFPDARHHCSAFVFHVDDAQPVERSSDDGEPSGTAGKPMLDVLKGSGMLDIAAVSVRYFGGIKLGTGGLVRAYSDSVSETLAPIQPVTRKLRQLYSFGVAHDLAGRLEAELRGRGVDVVKVVYTERVNFLVGTAPGGGQALSAVLAELTSGGVVPKDAGTSWLGA